MRISNQRTRSRFVLPVTLGDDPTPSRPLGLEWGSCARDERPPPSHRDEFLTRLRAHVAGDTIILTLTRKDQDMSLPVPLTPWFK